MKNRLIQLSKDYNRIEQAIHFLGENFQRQPDLHTMAQTVGMSEYHFQRIFRRWAGVSPKKFLQFLTKEHAKELLNNSNILDVSHEMGLSGPSRLHDLFIHCEAMTPGEYKLKGQGLTIQYGFHPSPFGKCLIALTDRGICGLAFMSGGSEKKFLNSFCQDWKNAIFQENQNRAKGWIEKIFDGKAKKGPIHLLCRGTNFQMKVWEALLMIPAGNVVTYKTLAERIGSPQAARAVGNAVGRNPIAYLIPCHRVIRSVGHLGGYRWGICRKRAMLGIETADQLSNA
jgi:AraC family transcriptional regulator of adaptative response/methylated-DNA-[protein]-cysteine methyltransferase